MTKQEFYTFILKQVRAKEKRSRKGFLTIFSIVTVAAFMFAFLIMNESFVDSIILAIIYSLIHIFIGFILWIPFITSVNNENYSIENLKKEYYEKFGETWYE